MVRAGQREFRRGYLCDKTVPMRSGNRANAWNLRIQILTCIVAAAPFGRVRQHGMHGA